ncbi:MULTISPECIES: hypothetical protein [unclassified Streptomyces]|uniref:hypothetical protein n=1 Tax=unclassified Streptomyces TaxID=2593676 RepID=UPI001315CA75|nr:hypothetical protein [Streptomyces sp. GS7]QHC20740.1 hypothetical protein GR130_04150 [Streptomyces sp. GS7]
MLKKIAAAGALAALLTLGGAATANASSLGSGSPAKWQDGSVGYAGGCAIAALWGVKCG